MEETADYGNEYIPLVGRQHLTHGGNGIQLPELIVLHAMGENIRDDKVYPAVEWLDHEGFSAHALATPGGSIIRLREDDEIAWHAKGFNTNSLGIEFLVKGEHSYFSFLEAMKGEYITALQYWAGVWQVRQWLNLWPIKRIATHRELSPGRKYDPGDGFPLRKFLSDAGWPTKEAA